MSTDQTLSFLQPQSSNGRVQIPSEILEEGELKWRNAVVAQFVGRIPNFSAFQKLVNVLWGEHGKVDLRPAGHNLFIIQFPNAITRERVLESGPWHIQNQPLIIRKWEPGLGSLEFNMEKLPIWIQMGNIPLELFTQRGISYLASTLGNPLYTDRITANQQRLAYAKVCVEVSASQAIPRSIEVELRNGKTAVVYVEVPWMPVKCAQCQIFGHGDKMCPKKKEVTKVWIPKKVEQKNDDKEPGPDEDESPKREGKQGKEKLEDGKESRTGDPSPNKEAVSTSNQFNILESVEDREEEDTNKPGMVEAVEKEGTVESRKSRAAAAGVADLMKAIKPKKKRPIKGRNKPEKVGNTTSGGKTSSPLL